MKYQRVCAALMLMSGGAGIAGAAPVSLIGGSLIVSQGSTDVKATALPAQSLVLNELFLNAPVSGGPFLSTASPVGTTVSLGTYTGGTLLQLTDHVSFGTPPTTHVWFTGAGNVNTDHVTHARFTFDPNTNGAIELGFEDIEFGGDLDFNDFRVSLTNVNVALVAAASAFATGSNNANVDLTVGTHNAFNGVFGNFVNGSTGAITNAGTLYNYGGVQNSGSIVNTGELLNDMPATISNQPNGLLTNSSTGVLNVFGDLQNLGEVRNAGAILVSAAEIGNAIGGLFSNEGDMTIAADAVFSNLGDLENLGNLSTRPGGSILSSGNLQNMAEVLNNGIFQQTDGTVTNTSMGSFTNSGGFIGLAGAFGNSGQLVNSLGGTFATEIGNMIENSGAFDNIGSAEFAGQFMNTVIGNLTNSGSLTVLGQFVNLGGIGNSGSVIVDAMGALSGLGGFEQTDGQTTVNGTLDGASLEILGGLLLGSGIIGAPTTIGPDGAVSPGNSPGTLHFSDDFTVNGGTLNIQLASLTDFDILEIGGAANFAEGLVNYYFLFTPEVGDTFTWLLGLNGITGEETLQYHVFGADGLLFKTEDFANTLVLTVTGTGAPVPLPAAAWLLLSGLAGFGAIGRRRRSAGLRATM